MSSFLIYLRHFQIAFLLYYYHAARHCGFVRTGNSMPLLPCTGPHHPASFHVADSFVRNERTFSFRQYPMKSPASNLSDELQTPVMSEFLPIILYHSRLYANYLSRFPRSCNGSSCIRDIPKQRAPIKGKVRALRIRGL